MIQSLKKNKYGILLMVLSSLFVCIGQLFWKLFSSNHSILILSAGFLLYGIGAMVMIVAYRFGSLSVLQPMLSVNYVLSLFIGTLILNESFTIVKCLGVVVITAGVLLIGGGDE
ncbi:MAG: EamA family transporter [Sporolactobacillus sp.]